MKWWWNGGVERKQNGWEIAECFFNLHFPTPAMEAMSRICACKTERNLQIFGWCLQFKQLCPWATLSYFCLQKQGREFNAMRWVVSENVLKRAQCYHSHGMRRSLFANWSHYIAAKKPQPLCENWNEKGMGEKRNCGHRLIMHSITRRDEMWGGGVKQGSIFWSKTDIYSPPPPRKSMFFPQKTAWFSRNIADDKIA